MIHYGNVRLVPELKRLWAACYPHDEPGYMDLFFRECFSPENCCAVIGDDGLESACYWLNARLNALEGPIPVLLLYAGGTFSQYRRKGNVDAIFKFVTAHCKENDISGFVINALATSKGAAERFGMKPDIFMQETVCRHGSGEHGVTEWSPCEFGEFRQLRKRHVDDIPFSIYWPEKELRYMYDELHHSGAVLKTVYMGQAHYAAVSIEESNRLVIRETDFPLEAGNELVCGVCGFMGYSGEVVVHTRMGGVPVIDNAVSETRYFAHSYFINPDVDLSDGKAYINLVAI